MKKPFVFLVFAVLYVGFIDAQNCKLDYSVTENFNNDQSCEYEIKVDFYLSNRGNNITNGVVNYYLRSPDYDSGPIVFPNVVGSASCPGDCDQTYTVRFDYSPLPCPGNEFMLYYGF